jgi:hypothetical protein
MPGDQRSALNEAQPIASSLLPPAAAALGAIAGLAFPPFPYPPYDIQLRFRSALCSALEQGVVSLSESPLGVRSAFMLGMRLPATVLFTANALVACTSRCTAYCESGACIGKLLSLKAAEGCMLLFASRRGCAFTCEACIHHAKMPPHAPLSTLHNSIALRLFIPDDNLTHSTSLPACCRSFHIKPRSRCAFWSGALQTTNARRIERMRPTTASEQRGGEGQRRRRQPPRK